MKMKIVPKKEYVTRDFHIAAFLLSQGHKIVYLNRDEPQRVLFTFADFKGREELLRSFLYGEALVEPQALITAQKTVRGLIHSDA